MFSLLLLHLLRRHKRGGFLFASEGVFSTEGKRDPTTSFLSVALRETSRPNPRQFSAIWEIEGRWGQNLVLVVEEKLEGVVQKLTSQKERGDLSRTNFLVIPQGRKKKKRRLREVVAVKLVSPLDAAGVTQRRRRSSQHSSTRRPK